MINERLWHRYFPVIFTKFFRTPILKNFYEWLLTNLFYQKKATCPKKIRKDNMNLSALVLLYQQNICVFQQPYISTWSAMTNQTSNFKRSKYKFFLCLRAEALNKPTWIQKELVHSLGGAVKLNLWTNGGSSESQKSVSFDSGVIW